MPHDVELHPSVSAKPERLSRADAAWLRMEGPTNPMVITALMTYAEPLSLRDLESFVDQRLLTNVRFRQRLVPGSRLQPATWALDPGFDAGGNLHHVALPRPGDDRELQRMVSDVMSRPLDARRPPWELYLVDAYAGGSALIVRLHHAVADGSALVRLLQSVTGGATEATPPVTHPAGRRPHRGPLARGGRAMAALGRLLLLPGDPRTSLRGAPGTAKRAAWSRAMPLAAIKEIAHGHDATMNDVFATLVAGGLRRYLEARGENRGDLEVRAVVPVNLRHEDDAATLGNRFGLVFLGLPLGIASPQERLREIARRTLALKESEEAVATFAMLEATALVTDAIDELVVNLFAAKATLVLTSVKGPADPVLLAGRRVRSMAFWAPQAGRVGLGLSLFSYAGEARVGVVSDAKVVAKPEEIVADFESDLDVLSH